MPRIISSREAGSTFEAFLDDVAWGPDAIAAASDWQIIDRLRERNCQVDIEQAERDIAEAIAEVRCTRRQTT